jgi:hypothetical protein
MSEENNTSGGGIARLAGLLGWLAVIGGLALVGYGLYLMFTSEAQNLAAIQMLSSGALTTAFGLIAILNATMAKAMVDTANNTARLLAAGGASGAVRQQQLQRLLLMICQTSRPHAMKSLQHRMSLTCRPSLPSMMRMSPFCKIPPTQIWMSRLTNPPQQRPQVHRRSSCRTLPIRACGHWRSTSSTSTGTSR